VSIDADTSVGTQTKSTKSGQNNMSLNDKLDQQLADDLKSIDDRGWNFYKNKIFSLNRLRKIYFSHLFKVKLMQLKEVNEEERLRMLESDDFLNFFKRNARILEKALDQDDIFFEYGASEKNAE